MSVPVPAAACGHRVSTCWSRRGHLGRLPDMLTSRRSAPQRHAADATDGSGTPGLSLPVPPGQPTPRSTECDPDSPECTPPTSTSDVLRSRVAPPGSLHHAGPGCVLRVVHRSRKHDCGRARRARTTRLDRADPTAPGSSRSGQRRGPRRAAVERTAGSDDRRRPPRLGGLESTPANAEPRPTPCGRDVAARPRMLRSGVPDPRRTRRARPPRCRGEVVHGDQAAPVNRRGDHLQGPPLDSRGQPGPGSRAWSARRSTADPSRCSAPSTTRRLAPADDRRRAAADDRDRAVGTDLQSHVRRTENGSATTIATDPPAFRPPPDSDPSPGVARRSAPTNRPPPAPRAPPDRDLRGRP